MTRVLGLFGAFAPEFSLLAFFLIISLWNITVPEITDVREVLSAHATAAGALDPMLVQSPLFVWLLGFFEKLFGTGLSVVRTLSLFSATLALGGMYTLALMLLKNRYASLTATVVLATSAGFSGIAITHGPTMLMLALSSFACAAWLLWLSAACSTRHVKWQLRQQALILGVLVSLVFLSGGLGGLLFVVSIIVCLTLFSRQAPALRQMPWRYFLVPILVIALPWPFFLLTRHSDTWLAYAQSVFNFDPIRIALFADTLLNGLWPYFIFLLAAVFEPKLLGRGRGGFDPLMVLVLSWLVAGVLFGGLFHPVFTLLPPAALILGLYLGAILEGQSGQRYAGLAVDLTVLMLMLQAVAMSALFYQEITDKYPVDLWHFPGPALVSEMFGIALFTTFAIWKLWLVPLPLFLLAGGLLMYMMSSSRRIQNVPMVLMAVALAAMFYIKAFYWPIMQRVVVSPMLEALEQHHVIPDRLLVDASNPDPLKIVPSKGDHVPREIRLFASADDLATLLKQAQPRHVWGIARERTYYDLPPEQRLRTQVMTARTEWHGFNIPDVTGVDLFGRRKPETLVLFRVLPHVPKIDADN